MGVSGAVVGPFLAPEPFTVLSSATRTANTASADFTNIRYPGVRLVLDITAATNTLDVKVQTKDAESGKYVDLPDAAFASKSATGTDTLTIHPSLTEAANETISETLASTWRVITNVSGASPNFTYSIGGEYLP